MPQGVGIIGELPATRRIFAGARLSNLLLARRSRVRNDCVFERIAQASSAGLLHIDLGGEVSFANGRWTELVGPPPKSFRNHHWLALFQEKDRARAAATWNRARLLHEPASGEVGYLDRNGALRWAELNVRPELSGGRMVGFIMELLDVSRRHQAEARLAHRSHLLALAESLAHVSQWRFDAAIRAVECSGQLKVIPQGPTSDPLSPAALLALVHPADRRSLLRALVTASRTPAPVEQSSRLLLPDGIRHVRLVAQAEYDPSGDVTGLYGLIQDVTVEETTLAEIAKARDEAQATAIATSDALAAMSQAIRTPMTGVLGMIDLLETDLPAKTRQRYFAILKHSAELLMTVLDEMADGDCIAADRPGQCANLDLNDPVQSTVDLVNGTASSKTRSTRPKLGANGTSPSLDLLVAEDNMVNRMIINMMVRSLGHRVTCAENGRLALELAATRHFDAILMDMQMPEMDGLTAARAIRDLPGPHGSVPIIALTADAAAEHRHRYDGVGLTDFLTKPIRRYRLAERLEMIATRRASVALPFESSDQALNVARYRELRDMLGRTKVRQLLDLLVTELDRSPRRIRECLGRGDLDAARAEAHSLQGAANNLGAIELGKVAAAIECSSSDAVLAGKLDVLDAQARRTVTAIAALR